MKKLLISITLTFLFSAALTARPCTPLGDQVTYGSSDTWIGYVYDNMGFTSYMGYVNEGTPGNPNFDENFGGDYVNYNSNGCPVYTESFSVRYKLRKTFAAGNYQLTVGADDGYRLSIDGGATWIINNWNDQSYTYTSYVTTLSGSYDIVLEYYENGGGNRVSFNVQTVCTGSENQSVYGSGNVWNGYIYDGTNFNLYSGMATEGSAGSSNFDESFGGDNVLYNTSACGVQTETFSARYRLQKTLANGNYIFTIGGDDGYRLSLDGGSTWVINQWSDQPYTTSTYSATLNGTYNFVLEYYENGGQNRISFNLTASVLPVQLVSFSGKATDKNISLTWTAAKEVNSSYYEVERSSSGTDFIPQGKVYAGTQLSSSGAVKTYGYTDLSPASGSNYYRLRTVDIDGNYSYSPVIRILYTVKNSIAIFPTVVSAGTSVQVRSSADLKNAGIELYEITGKKIQEIKLPALVGAGQTISLSLHTGNFTKGSYLLLIKSGGVLLGKQLLLIE